MESGKNGQVGKVVVYRAEGAIIHVLESALDLSLVGKTALDRGTRQGTAIHLNVQVCICFCELHCNTIKVLSNRRGYILRNQKLLI